MVALTEIHGPDDLRLLDAAQLDDLAQQIRTFLVREVSRTGGHLGPNLGVVELTMAVHRVFQSPHDQIVFDTGHQCYVHKLLTGRQDFSALKRQGGLSGYPSRAESEHDIVESSHASSSLSWADGLAKANQLTGRGDRHVVAIVGDGALTGGMAWEALNNIAVGQERNLVIVVNDNERSYAPTIGGLSERLAKLRTLDSYEKALDLGKSVLQRGGTPGRLAYGTLHGMKKGIKDIVAPQGLFEDLGLKYVGPVDGHDLEAMEFALGRAKSFGGPVIVHAITEKGRGYAPARNDQADQFHAIGVIDPETGKPVSSGRGGVKWTSVFADEIVQIADERPDVVGITAAMLIPVGLHRFAERYPDRVFDVGIAEQHAVTSAAGMAHGGLHPVVAVYATFMNRAFDQVLMDVALHREGVTFVLDRAGVTGDDGASHNGMWDLSLLGLVPGIRIAAPRDAVRLRELLREAVAVEDAPTVLRFQKGQVADEVPALERVGNLDVLHREGDEDVLVVAVGSMTALGLEVAQRLNQQGIGVTVVDPRWVLPVNEAVPALAARHQLVVVVEDGGVSGGVASHVSSALSAARVPTAVRGFGIPQEFLDHASRAQVLEHVGLTAQEVSREVVEHFSRQAEVAMEDLPRP
ncbi:1-deoxy-D-xylulose-5-phosphate synthase [Kineosporia rhizophila]|uniref:1-deoxy-D-xylulose-5-phosphate synthase n=1 Tax=Kineosporia TaxID=49184 RepID=UPI001E3D3C33|nr:MULTISPECIES: 1-deoxy-D-xylulose-5-phosphate synthase [Kineosporia]MCE0537344.1 1-deoxy-D-xylulose-5-phosphate synthase [Kineosporia rhizophila]GLY17510.1 1-deoxy-D-xylulose-5-phosphate synthase 2 [Kineosporia sp. NBRC 101677]